MPTLILTPRYSEDAQALCWHIERLLNWRLPDELKLVTEIVHWEKEFRCFILNRTLQTFSVYLRDGALQSQHDFIHTEPEDREVRAFMETILADDRVEIPAATVIDEGFSLDLTHPTDPIISFSIA